MFIRIDQFNSHDGQEVNVNGWVANKRESKGIVFLLLRDGSGFAQCVVAEQKVGSEVFEESRRLTLESSVELWGDVVKDERQTGGYELHVKGLKVISHAEEYPIGKKAHGVEFLSDHRHLWLRSRRQWAIMRVRNRIIYAIHQFFQEEGFIQMDAPVFTGNACEGTSDLFETHYFDRPAYLTQSGQLYGEAMAMAMGKIYTFGPTFRAEKSRTRRHLSEFWMIEPEMAFYDNAMNMDLIEKMINRLVAGVLEHCRPELEIVERDVHALERSLGKFPRITYDEAAEILRGTKSVNGATTLATLEADLAKTQHRIEQTRKEMEACEAKINRGGIKKGEINYLQNKLDQLKNKFRDLEENERNIPQWIESARNFKHGGDFGGSDETVLTRLFDKPVMVYNWPHQVKAFYMKRLESDERYAKGVDVLAPEGYGEIVGGGERETNKDLIIAKIHEHKLPMEAFEWYLDLRRYGSVPHAGFGLGLERFVAWICGLKHVRETIPFPRWYGRLIP